MTNVAMADLLTTLLATYGRRRERRRVERALPIVIISSQTIRFRRDCSTSVHKQRSISVMPRISNHVAHLYIGRKRRIGAKRILTIVSRIPCRTTLHATRTGIDTTRTGIRATQVRLRNGRTLFSRGIVSSCRLSLTHGKLTMTLTRLRRTGTRRASTHGGLSCARVGDPDGKIMNALPFHVNTLIDPNVARPFAMISSGTRVCTCFSISRGGLHRFEARCNSVSGVVSRVPRINLRLGSNAFCKQGKHVRAIDNIIGTAAKTIRVGTHFPGPSHRLLDNAVNGVILRKISTSTVLLPGATAIRLRSGVVTCHLEGKGTRTTCLAISHLGSNGRFIIGRNISINSAVVARKMKLMGRKVVIAPGGMAP